MRICKRSVLKGRPPHKSVVSDKGGYFAVGTGHGDALVDSAGKVGDTVFKVVVCDLHDVWSGVGELVVGKRG